MRNHVGWLNNFNEGFKPGCDLQAALDEYDLLNVPTIHKSLVISVKSKYWGNLTESFLRFVKNLGWAAEHHHYLNFISLKLSSAKLGDIIEFDFELVLFYLAILGFVREIDEYRVIDIKVLVSFVSKIE